MSGLTDRGSGPFVYASPMQAPRVAHVGHCTSKNVLCVVKSELSDCRRQEGEGSIPDAPI
jgi:hypothetical protein